MPSGTRTIARIAGAFYSVTFVAGLLALILRVGAVAALAGALAAVSYVAVSVLFYFLFAPVNRPLSLLACIISLGGVSAGLLRVAAVNSLVFFGVYCLLIAYLILRSDFVPHILGALLAFAGLGWLTFLSASVARQLYPYNFAPGIIGEGALTVWLLAFGTTSAQRRQSRSPRL